MEAAPTTVTGTTDSVRTASEVQEVCSDGYCPPLYDGSSTSESGTSSAVPKTSRKRRRPLFLVRTSASNCTDSPGSSTNNYNQLARSLPSEWHILHQPDLAHVTQLLGGLLLSSSLALISGFDAKTQCIAHEQEAYSLLDLVDDDKFQEAHTNEGEDGDEIWNNVYKCKVMFRLILLPTGITTWALGLIGFFLIHRFNSRQRELEQEQQQKLQPTQRSQDTLQLVRKLFCLLLPLLVMQSYSITAVLLSGGPFLKNIQSLDWDTATNNPYQNLAAVDKHGHVGLNANLYYTSWISQGLTIVLVYQTLTASVRLARVTNTTTQQRAMLPAATSWFDDESTSFFAAAPRQQDRFQWYKSLYRLRLRTGFWVAAFLSSLTIVASSQYVWTHLLGSFAAGYNSDSSTTSSTTTTVLRSRTVCRIVEEHSDYPHQLCGRTVASWLAGVVGAALCATAIGMHLAGRYRHNAGCTSDMELSTWEKILVQNRFPLRTELLLSVVLSILLGLNAVSCTGVQGPASTVGTLYYSSWLSFLLCVRISLGCLEECHNLDDELLSSVTDKYHDADQIQGDNNNANNNHSSNALGSPPSGISKDSSNDQNQFVVMEERERKQRVRRYLFLSVFSLVCSASSWDASYNNQTKKLNRIQKYIMLAPLIVTLIAGALFCLCLKLEIYRVITRKILLGPLLSAVCFAICMTILLPTMHSEDSWAVNGIGEILNANLYYFTWASVLTAGIQLMGYTKAMLKTKAGDTMSLVWAGIGKTSFVILSASLHIWHTIADNCGFEEIQSGAVTFCSRTILALAISMVGMLVSFLIVTGRTLMLTFSACRCYRFQAHVELVVSLFCVFLFGAGVAMITCIGGPGQSVGDLFYSTWLSFMVSIGIFLHCYEQLKIEDGKSTNPHGDIEMSESDRASNTSIARGEMS